MEPCSVYLMELLIRLFRIWVIHFSAWLSGFRHIRVALQGQFESDAFCLVECVHDVGQQFVQIEFTRQQGGFARRHAFEIEDVIDQAQEMPPTEFHVGEVSQLLIALGIVDEQIGQAEDGVEGVRISWLITDRNLDLASLAACAAFEVKQVRDVVAVQVEMAGREVDHLIPQWWPCP